MSTEQSTDKEIVERFYVIACGKHHPENFSAWIREHCERLYPLLLDGLRARRDAEQLLQDKQVTEACVSG